ncbi:MAG: acyl-CoA dehydrogenase, partial [Mycolicibacterium sp.]|nr:acyl-CoA dehydrogenase [Mycolicibacterium sp.]
MTQQIEHPRLGAVRPELPYVELTGFEVLSDEERDVQQAMHKFARDVMRPAGIAIDKLSAEQAVAPDSPYWEFMATVAASGIEFDAGSDDVAPQALARLQSILIEEFGWGDVGLTVSLAAASFPNLLAKRIGN